MAEASPFFGNLLSFQTGEVKFSVVTLAELEKVLEFIYTGSVSFDNIQHFERFVANVKKLGLRRLPNLEEP